LSSTGALLCVAAAGCASEGAKPNDELTKAHTVVEQAVKGGAAQRYAAADLQRANDELSEADRLNAKGKYNDARAYAQRAEVDADVAVARGNSAEQQRAAADVTKGNGALRHETDRNNDSAAATDSATTPLTSAPPSSTTPPQF
jgi:hypothetical protein